MRLLQVEKQKLLELIEVLKQRLAQAEEREDKASACVFVYYMRS